MPCVRQPRLSQAITDRHKGLEVQVSYRGKLGDPENFLAAPWEMELLRSVANACFGVILVDAPPGDLPVQRAPGEGRLAGRTPAAPTSMRARAIAAPSAWLLLLRPLRSMPSTVLPGARSPPPRRAEPPRIPG